jgi:O-methyltransferase
MPAPWNHLSALRLFVPPIVSVLRAKWRDRGRPKPNIPDSHLYRPIYSPWLGNGDFGSLRDVAAQKTLVSADRLWILYSLGRQLLAGPGDFVECGVFKGGTARLFADMIERSVHSPRRLRLFDTFAGMPEVDGAVDKHLPGDFSDTSLADVQKFVGMRSFINWHQGLIPQSFAGIDWDRIALLHIDVDIRQSVSDALKHLFPYVMTGGVVVFDDYGFQSCYGARLAVNEFFAGRPEVPLVLPTGQAIVIKQ